MSVRDDGPVDALPWVDVKIARGAIEPGVCQFEKTTGADGAQRWHRPQA